jgi:hypothetical protein
LTPRTRNSTTTAEIYEEKRELGEPTSQLTPLQDVEQLDDDATLRLNGLSCENLGKPTSQLTFRTWSSTTTQRLNGLGCGSLGKPTSQLTFRTCNSTTTPRF